MSERDAGLPGKRGNVPVRAAADQTDTIGDVIETMYDPKPVRLTVRPKKKSASERKQFSITVSREFAQKLRAVAIMQGMFPGDVIEREVDKRVDELLQRGLKRWDITRPGLKLIDPQAAVDSA